MLDIRTSSRSRELTYFWLGLVATFAYRLIIILNFFDPMWVKVAWYVGTVGFIFYFWSRYTVVRQFLRLIREQDLERAVQKSEGITNDQRKALAHIVESLAKTKAQLNYQVIFILSFLSLLVGMVLDVLKV